MLRGAAPAPRRAAPGAAAGSHRPHGSPAAAPARRGAATGAATAAAAAARVRRRSQRGSPCAAACVAPEQLAAASDAAPPEQQQQPPQQQQLPPPPPPPPAQQPQPQLQPQQPDWLAAAVAPPPPGPRATALVLGSPPGVAWHARRRSGGGGEPLSSTAGIGDDDWVAQQAAVAILSALQAPAAADATGGAPAPALAPAAQQQGAQQLEQQLEQLEQQLEDLQPDEQAWQQAAAWEPAEFTLLEERAASHAAASSSGRPQGGGGSDAAGAGEGALAWPEGVDADALLWVQRGPAANFRDPGFERALSRWIKEAPDWFKVRSVFERYAWRLNVVSLACCLARLAQLLEPFAGRRLLRKENAALQAFLGEVLAATAALLPSVDGATGAALLTSVARLQAAGKLERAGEFVDSLLLHMQHQLAGLSPRHLAGTLWALGRLQHRPSDAWLAALYADTQPTLAALRGDEVAVLLRGLSAVRAAPPPQAWLGALLGHAEEHLEGMDPKALAMLLVGLAHMEVRPSRGWLDAVMAALRGRFDAMGPQALSNVLWALSHLGCLPDRAWLGAYFGATLQLLHSMTPAELAVGAWALGRLRLEPGDEWLDEFFDQSEAKLLAFSLKDLALIGYALARLGLRPPQTWLRRYCTLLLRHKAGLWRQKALLTQVLVALDSFKVPRMDMWRRELYAAAGYKLYKYHNWRQRVRAASPAAPPPYSPRRRFGRRGAGARELPAGAGGGGGGARGGGVPAALRSGDWGVMDGLGGSRGVLGSMGGSYEELGSAASGAGEPAEPPAPGSPGSPGAGGSAWASRDEGGGGGGGGGGGAAAELGWGRAARPAPRRLAASGLASYFYRLTDAALQNRGLVAADADVLLQLRDSIGYLEGQVREAKVCGDEARKAELINGVDPLRRKVIETCCEHQGAVKTYSVQGLIEEILDWCELKEGAAAVEAPQDAMDAPASAAADVARASCVWVQSHAASSRTQSKAGDGGGRAASGIADWESRAARRPVSGGGSGRSSSGGGAKLTPVRAPRPPQHPGAASGDLDSDQSGGGPAGPTSTQQALGDARATAARLSAQRSSTEGPEASWRGQLSHAQQIMQQLSAKRAARPFLHLDRAADASLSASAPGAAAASLRTSWDVSRALRSSGVAEAAFLSSNASRVHILQEGVARKAEAHATVPVVPRCLAPRKRRSWWGSAVRAVVGTATAAAALGAVAVNAGGLQWLEEARGAGRRGAQQRKAKQAPRLPFAPVGPAPAASAGMG
ncbi:TBC2 [Scenedesmus sp. PABB004]|nr:TBC2 [Scenedesmus sp. PABB004]